VAGQADDASVAIDRIEAATHPRPQDRRLHARGGIYTGKFIPSGHLSGMTIAPHLRYETDVVVRMSNGAPTFDADDRRPGVRGMAVKFVSDGDTVADLVAANFTVFPSREPEGFIEHVELLGYASAGRRGLLHGLPLLLRLLRPAESRRGLLSLLKMSAPASFATVRYDGIHAFFLVDDAGRRRPFRYRLLPELGEIALSKEHAATLPVHFLTGELDDRLSCGPVAFTLAFQFAEPDDPTDDPTRTWPDNRLLLPAGRIVITGRHPDEDDWQRAVFDPTHAGAGVEVSADPVLNFRPRAYAVSAQRRLNTQEMRP
jgi:catalase